MSIVIGTGRWARRLGEVDRRLRGLRGAVAEAERGGDAEAGGADRGEARLRRARRPKRGPTRSGARAASPGRCRSAKALIARPPRRRGERPGVRLAGTARAGRRRRGGRRGRRGRSRPSAPTRRVTGTGRSSAGPPRAAARRRDEPGRRLARLHEDRDPRGDDLLGLVAGRRARSAASASSAPGCDGLRLVGRGDDARRVDRGGERRRRAERRGEHGDGHVGQVDAVGPRRGQTAESVAAVDARSRGDRLSRPAAARSAAGSRSASSASTRARRRVWVVAVRRSGRRSRAARPSCRTGPGAGPGSGDGCGEQHRRPTIRRRRFGGHRSFARLVCST